MNICLLPAEDGLLFSNGERKVCAEYMRAWFYNKQTGNCEAFVYGGCGGNPNRFYSKRECEKCCIKN